VVEAVIVSVALNSDPLVVTQMFGNDNGSLPN
jgi:hypothetical protein